MPAAYAQTDLPDSIKVPDGHKIALETVGTGEITYECREKANAAGQTEWTFVGPKAVLNDRNGNRLALTSDRLLPGKLKTALKSQGHNWQLPPQAPATSPISWSRPTLLKIKRR